MKAFNNDEAQKGERVEQAKQHVAMDQLMRGTYGEGEFGTTSFRGCSIGCLYNGGHYTGAKKDQIPIELLYLVDGLFENLPDTRFRNWHIEWVEAIPVGADLSLIKWKFFYWLIHDKTDGVYAVADDKVKFLLDTYEFLLKDAAKGNLHPKEKFAEAMQEAQVAQTARAPRTAWAARAAQIAWAAQTARAARAAWVAWAAQAAWATQATRQADKLLELLREAK